MANFFKDYQSGIRAKRAAELEAEREEKRKARAVDDFFDSLQRGERVKVNAAYAESGYMYFSDTLNAQSILLSDDKREAMRGYGYIYDKNIIILANDL